MRLSKMALPAEIEVGGKFFAVHTGHPYWFRFSELMKQSDVRFTDFDFLYIDRIPEDRKAGFDGLFDFFQPKKELPRVSVAFDADSEIALDYVLDADLIYAAVLEQYGIDLFDREIHWHKVRAMIDSLHSTRLNDVIGYRLYRKPKKTGSYENEMMRLKKMWHIETAEEKMAEALAEEREKDFFSRLKKSGLKDKE